MSVRVGLCRLAAAACAAAISLSARAQEAPSAPDPEAWINPVVVTARRPGPALWRVTKGDAELVILGVVGPVPEHLAWDTVRVEKALTGAHELLLRPVMTVGLGDLFSFFAVARRLRAEPDHTLERELSPAEHARWTAACQTIGREPACFNGWKLNAAGLQILAGYNRRAGLSSAEPERTVVRLARARKVPVRRVTSTGLDLLRALPETSPARAHACFDGALDQLDHEREHAEPAARAWTVGDLQQVRRHYTRAMTADCYPEKQIVQAQRTQALAEQLAALQAALSRPGRTVAVMELGDLLSPDGLLQRLRGDGVRISEPSD